MFEAFNNYADFSGRAARSEYWWFQLLNLLVLLPAAILVGVGVGSASVQGMEAASSSTPFLIGVTMIVFWVLIAFVPSLSVGVRRFHDHNVSGWWYVGLVVVSMMPYIGFIATLAILWVTVRAGTWGPNNFGPDPVNRWRGDTTFA